MNSLDSTLGQEEREARFCRKLAVRSFEEAFTDALEGDCQWALRKADFGRWCLRKARVWDLAVQSGEGN